MNDNSMNSSMDDEDDDFDFYNNPAAQFNKIKQQKEKETASKLKMLEDKFKYVDDEKVIIVSEAEDQTKTNDSNVIGHENIGTDAVIEITDSQSPKHINTPDYIYEDLPSNRRATRSSTRRRGRPRVQVTAPVHSTPKNKGKRSSLDKGLEALEQVANKLKAAKHNNGPVVLNDSPLLIESDEDESENIVNVKVVWRHGEPHSFPIVKKKDIASIYEFFAKRENVNIENIILIKNDKALSPHCTPLSIEYKVTDILEGGILQNGETKPSQNQQDKNCIEVKVQQKNVKKPLLIQLHKSNDMHILAKKVSSELGIDEAKLKFNFDGDALDLDETVESLDLDGGECFDLVVLS